MLNVMRKIWVFNFRYLDSYKQFYVRLKIKKLGGMEESM